MTDTDDTKLVIDINTNTLLAAIKHGEARAALAASDVENRIGWIAHPDDDTIKVPVVMVQGVAGSVDIKLAADVLDHLDHRRAGPMRRRGCIELTDVASLIAVMQRWGDDNTVVYADTAEMQFIAVLNDHPSVDGDADIDDDSHDQEATAWRDHRAEYACPRSTEWAAWTSKEGRVLSQVEFAEFLESRLEDMSTGEGMPVPLDVLKMARDLQIRTKGTFGRSFDPVTGDSSLVNSTETVTGSTVIPRAFLIAIPVFEGGVRYKIEARIRFQLVDGKASFSYVLHQRIEVQKHAFDEVAQRIRAETDTLVVFGKPG